MEFVRASGLEIAYERAGERPPLVFVHGAAGDGRVWQPQLAALADEFTVVAWDEPGAGRSSDLPAMSPASRGAAPSCWSSTVTAPTSPPA